MIKNVYWSLLKVPAILVTFYWSLNFLGRFSKNNQISDFIKIRQVGAELFHAGRRIERRTDMTKLIVAFRHFANAPKNVYVCMADASQSVRPIIRHPLFRLPFPPSELADFDPSS